MASQGAASPDGYLDSAHFFDADGKPSVQTLVVPARLVYSDTADEEVQRRLAMRAPASKGSPFHSFTSNL